MIHWLRKTAKDALSIPFVRKALNVGNRIFLEIFGNSRILAHVIYTLFPLTFNREQSAVLHGQRSYYRSLNLARRSHVELRRNIHRLEKGLAMLPRRENFAVDYISETLEFYECAARQFRESPESIDQGEIQWAHDVLTAYFSANIKPNKIIDIARVKFSRLDLSLVDRGTSPFSRRKSNASISYDQLLKLAEHRRSVRFFTDKPVERELIDRALRVASLSPTACNRMPYEFLIFDHPEDVQAVASIPFGTIGYNHQIPMIAVLIGKLDNYFSSRDRHAIYIDSSLATMSFLFALETLGLSSCAINWPDFEPLERKMQRLLGLETSDRIVMLIAIGYEHPDSLVPFSKKKELDSFRFYSTLAAQADVDLNAKG